MKRNSSRRIYAICSVLVGMFIGLSLMNLGSNEIFNFVASSTNTFGTEFSDLTSKRVFNGIETVEWCQCKIERDVEFLSLLFSFQILCNHKNSPIFFDVFFVQLFAVPKYPPLPFENCKNKDFLFRIPVYGGLSNALLFILKGKLF